MGRIFWNLLFWTGSFEILDKILPRSTYKWLIMTSDEISNSISYEGTDKNENVLYTIYSGIYFIDN